MQFNPFTGKLFLNTATEENEPGIATPVVLLQDAPALTCLIVVDDCGTSINAAYELPVVGRPTPWVDAVTLEAGERGDTVRCAMCWGQRYRVEDGLLSDAPLPDGYYLGRDSRLALAPPVARWKARVARWVNDREFIFAPEAPVDALNPGTGTGPGPGPVTDPTLAQVVLGAPMAANTPFQFGPDLRIYPITTTDENFAPRMHGLLLESGGVGDTRKGATMEGVLYKSQFPFESNGIHFLSLQGKLTTAIPKVSNGDIWNCVVLNVINEYHFIIAPQPPIFLRRS